ncbi:heme-dependent oxidative N-demethylase subunit alpha family protein, partial [Parvularcula marina]|uniref:heme-dependent oxidative N-demethylase subunit alpha family protein n=1 Tax=Parvularcula marina TaxID=2292771 RepID=UPI0035126616
MSTSPYIPFENGHPGFKIALKPLDPARWIEPDEGLGDRLTEKAHLDETAADEVFRASPEADAAQRETLRLLSRYLLEHHPSFYWKDGSVIHLPTACLLPPLAPWHLHGTSMAPPWPRIG